MAEILLLQGDQPAFRLAAWVLREENYNVSLIERPEEAPSVFPAGVPDLVVINSSASVKVDRELIESVRAFCGDCPVLHLSLDLDHTVADCRANACCLPPHRGDDIVRRVRSILEG